MVWYSNFGEQNLGKLDPKTGKVTEYRLPELKKGWPTGSLGIRADHDGNLWLGMMYQGAIAKFDPRRGKVQTFSLPADMNKDMAQVNMVRPDPTRRRQGLDAEQRLAAMLRLDLATGQSRPSSRSRIRSRREPQHLRHRPGSAEQRLFHRLRPAAIGRVDAKTGQITLFELPTKASAPRRGRMDAQDRIWFAEYRANRVAMFDTKTEKFQEWEMPTPYSAPYDVVMDKNGEVWTGWMINDRIYRVDTKTGKFVEYLLPRETNIRRVFVDNSTTPVTFWVGNNHRGSIVKLEPLD